MRTIFNQFLANSTLCVCCNYHPNQKNGFCLGCYQDLPHLKTPCLHCGLPLIDGQFCTCKAEDWPFTACISAFSYQFPIKQLISQYKNQARLALCLPMAQALVTQIRHLDLPLPQLLIPVPTHAQKLKQRGFNQSAELAKNLAQLLNIPVDLHSLQLAHQTNSQKQLSKQQRQHNTAHIYQLNKPISATHIAIIDDVITTGATTKSLAYLLREQGAKQIQTWTIARTLVKSTQKT